MFNVHATRHGNVAVRESFVSKHPNAVLLHCHLLCTHYPQFTQHCSQLYNAWIWMYANAHFDVAKAMTFNEKRMDK